MINYYVELLRVDVRSAYFICFGFLRKLAMHLRKVMATKNEVNVGTLYNWGMLNGLRLWVRAVTVFPNQQEELGQLTYPLIEIVLGIFHLYPKTKYLPFRLHILDLLTTLSKNTGIYIPIIPHLIETMRLNTFTRKVRVTKKGTKQLFELDIALKLTL
jgi:nucleolar complex protein 2